MELLFIKYGYVLLFLGIAVEGEVFLLAAAVLAHRGTLQLPLVILVAICSNCASAQVYYMIARARGRAWLEARFGQHAGYQKLVAWMARYGNWLLLLSRYAFGFRIIIPATCGALQFPTVRFTLINIVAGAIWAIPVALVGFYFGQAVETALAHAGHYNVWFFAGLTVAAGSVLLVRHLRHAEWVEDLKVVDLHMLVPSLIGLMGIINIVSAIVPRSQPALHAVRNWLPLEMTQGSRPVMLLAGVVLLQMTHNLARRKEVAWYVTVIALSITLVTHITRDLDLHHSVIAGLLLAYLWIYRRRFYARSDPASLRLSVLMIPLLLGTVFVYGYVGLSYLEEQYRWRGGATPLSEAFNSSILIREPRATPLSRHADYYLRSLQIAGWLVRFYLLVLVLRPVILRKRQEASPEAVQRIYRAHGRHSVAAFAIQGDKHHRLAAGGNTLVAYAIRGSVAVSAGDPLASNEDFEQCVREYLDYSGRNGWVPCFYHAAEDRLPIYHNLGLRSLKISEEALISLDGFSPACADGSNLQGTIRRISETGMEVQLYSRCKGADPAIDDQLEAISQEWLTVNHVREFDFTLDRFSLEAITPLPVFVAGLGNRIEAFCTWLPYRDGAAVVLDLMRSRTKAPAGTLDFMIYHSLVQLKGMGYREASLGITPLAGATEARGALDLGAAVLLEKMMFLYGNRDLLQFKQQFAPHWEGKYLVYPGGADLPHIAYALEAVHGAGGFLQLVRR